MMTVDESIKFLLANNTGLGPSLNTIMVSGRALRELPPGSPAYLTHRQILDAELEKVSEAATRLGFEDAGVDPVLGMAACDCQANEPCCMESGFVADADGASRKVLWPSALPPRRFENNLLVIAKEISGRNLSSRVKVNWTGSNCCFGKPETPHIRPGCCPVPKGYRPNRRKSASVSLSFPASPLRWNAFSRAGSSLH